MVNPPLHPPIGGISSREFVTQANFSKGGTKLLTTVFISMGSGRLRKTTLPVVLRNMQANVYK